MIIIILAIIILFVEVENLELHDDVSHFSRTKTNGSNITIKISTCNRY